MGKVENTQGDVSRRTVTKAMAWAVPAVAVATTVPYAAASCVPTTLTVDPTGSCKRSNGNDYVLTLIVRGNDCTATGCTGTITKIVEKTGQHATIWEGSKSLGEGIVICDANNMASSVWVYATLSCLSTPPAGYFEVSMPTLSSTTGCASGCP